MEDWYRITAQDIQQYPVSQHFKSLSNLLQCVYQEYPWTLWRFEHIPRGFWSNFNLKSQDSYNFLQWLSPKLQIRSLNDWYRVSVIQLHKFIPLGGFRRSTLPHLLQEAYPTHNWDMSKFYLEGKCHKISTTRTCIGTSADISAFG